MIVVNTVAPDIAAELQRREQRYVCGSRIDLVLKRNGLPPQTATPADESDVLALHPRGADIGNWAMSPCLIEGPLTHAQLALLGLEATSWRADAVALAAEQLDVEVSLGSQFTVRRRTGTGKLIKIDEADSQSPDDLHHARPIEGQYFALNPAWRPIVEATINGEKRAIAVSDGRRIVFGFPIFDMLAYALAWAPLDEGFYRFRQAHVSFKLEKWFIDLIKDLAKQHAIPHVQVSSWPDAKSWALMVRHDYDRLITDAEYASLCGLYERHGLRPNWFFLPHKLIRHQARELLRRGHEIGLHTTAENEAEFASQIDALSQVLRRRVRGVTAHGGDYIGFLGDRQYKWAEACGLDYSESLSIGGGQPFTGLAARDGSVRALDLVLMPAHNSLDSGTGAHQHNLDFCMQQARQKQASGDCFVLMNHPDIHRPQIAQFLEAAAPQSAWRPTMPEMAAWCKATRRQISVQRSKARVRVALAAPIEQDVVFTLSDGGRGREFTVARGEKFVEVGLKRSWSEILVSRFRAARKRAISPPLAASAN